MSSQNNPASQQDAPPSYAVATGSSAASTQDAPTSSAHLQVPLQPAASRKSMEDEVRPLPEGWVRQWDTTEQHQFFVDTKVDPPRSIWIHPLDDEETMRSLSTEERERLQEEEAQMKRRSSVGDTTGEKSEKSGKGESAGRVPAYREEYPSELPSRPSQPHVQSSQKKGFGEKFKDKLTGTTHEERERIRAQQAAEERQYYEMHARFRAAMQKAAMTGEPQFFAKDRDGRDIFVEPPSRPGYYGNRGGFGYGPQSYGFNPYGAGPYSAPNSRFIRPNYGYGRPGYGSGLALPVAGGLLGGALLGGLIF